MKDLWQQSKFDENFNEISYKDNYGNSFEFIDPVKRTLRFYKNNKINLSQEMLNNIRRINPKGEMEQIFLKTLYNLVLWYPIETPNYVFLSNKFNGRWVLFYDIDEKAFWYSKKEIYDPIELCRAKNKFQRISFVLIEDIFKKYLNIGKVIPEMQGLRFVEFKK